MQSKEISFVTWPDGKVDDKSLTVAGEQHSRAKMICQWLPEDWFGKAPSGYVLDSLWRGMSEKGFRVWTIKIADGEAVMAEQ